MAVYEAKMKYADVRIITIIADSDEEARRKYDAGEWDDEYTVDFYSVEEMVGLHRVEAKR